jgi:hypothetical protein
MRIDDHTGPYPELWTDATVPFANPVRDSVDVAEEVRRIIEASSTATPPVLAKIKQHIMPMYLKRFKFYLTQQKPDYCFFGFYGLISTIISVLVCVEFSIPEPLLLVVCVSSVDDLRCEQDCITPRLALHEF